MYLIDLQASQFTAGEVEALAQRGALISVPPAFCGFEPAQIKRLMCLAYGVMRGQRWADEWATNPNVKAEAQP